jgi:GNAT superfamily N-acetyltransferase
MAHYADDLPEIVIGDAGSEADGAELRDAVHEFNFAATGYRDARSFSCYLRDESGTLVAGIDGYTWGGYGRIEYLWVHDALRGRGIGTQLVAAAEHEARERGCVKLVLDSHSFQAPTVYSLLGYREVATTSDTPVGYSDTLLEKPLK